MRIVVAPPRGSFRTASDPIGLIGGRRDIISETGGVHLDKVWETEEWPSPMNRMITRPACPRT